MARHISDLSDPDANHFGLLGGQDGWLLSENSLDLWEKWKRREYVMLPLRPETVAAMFPHVLDLRPGSPRPQASGAGPVAASELPDDPVSAGRQGSA